MKILFFGDIVGKAGRQAVKKALSGLKAKHEPDLVIANAENLAHGLGATRKTVLEMLDAGVNFFTSGNHIWQQKEAEELLRDREIPLIRPANYPPETPGDGYRIVEVGVGKFALIISLLGQTFFDENLDSPMRTMDKILAETKNKKINAIIVDFHKEVTSEMQALGFYLDGRVSAVLGTHTHIPTADERVLPAGTAFITDVGMAGVRDSSLGVDVQQVIKWMLTQRPIKFDRPEEGLCRVDAVVIDIDPANRQAKSIERINAEVEI